MKKTFLLLLFFAIFLQNWARQNMAWEISYFDDKKAYLVGSIHAGTPEMYPLPREMMKAFAESDELAVEANQTGEIDMKLFQKEMAKSHYREGTLQDSIPAELYERLLERCSYLGLNLQHYHRTKPWYLTMILQAKQVEKAGLQLQYGIDNYFMAEAKKAEKPILDVEGVIQQLQFLSNLPDSTQQMLLSYTLLDFETYEKEAQELVDIWIEGDTKQLEEVILRTYHEYKELQPLFDAWIAGRNYNMAEKVEEYIHSDKTVFVVVGAAHVVGEHGIIQILRRKGYFIRRL